jgi:hypothetical protein
MLGLSFAFSISRSIFPGTAGFRLLDFRPKRKSLAEKIYRGS